MVSRTAAGRLPGFRLALASTLVWLGLIVAFPLTALIARPFAGGLHPFMHALFDPRLLAALRVSFGSAFVAAAIDLPLGLLLAWAVVRAKVPGHRLMDALVELPLALPTSVSGITLATLYGPRGWFGAPLAHLGLKVAFAPAGIVVALMFVGIPFVVRSIAPVLANAPVELEEAAQTLGASRAQTLWRVVLPPLLPAGLTAFGLAFARAVGEYGSVIFIAGNQPFRSEIAPLLVVIRLQEFDYAGGAAVGLILLLASLVILLALGALRRRFHHWIAA